MTDLTLRSFVVFYCLVRLMLAFLDAIFIAYVAETA